MAKSKQQNRSYLKQQRQQDRRRRKEQQRVTEPMTGKDIRRETRTQTNMKFRPLEREIAGEIGASKKRTGEVGDWWSTYLDEVNKGRAETAGAYAQAGATSAAQMAQASSIDSANTQRLDTDAAASAALRGVEPSQAPAQREAAMQAQRNYLAQAQANTTGQLGANQFGYLTDQKRIGVGQSIAGRTAEQGRTRSLERDRRATRRERGDYSATKRTELRGKEFEKKVQTSAFNLDKKTAAQEARDDAAKNRIDQKNADTSAGNLTQREREENYDRNQDRRGGKGNLTPSERRDQKEAWKNAWTEGLALYNSEPPPDNPQDWAKFQRVLAEQSEVSPRMAQLAVEKLKKKAQRERAKKRKEDQPRREDAKEHGWID